MHQWIIPLYECLMWKERQLFSTFLNNRNYSAILATMQGGENGRVVTIAFLSWDTQLQLSIIMFIVLFVLSFFTLYIVVLTLKIDHCLVFISIKWYDLILSYLILRVYESDLISFRHSKRSLHLVKFLFNNNKYFSNFFNWIQVAIHSGYDNWISVAIYVSFTFRNKI